MLSFNPILAVDSYKLSHAFAYPKAVTGMFSYIEARTNGKDIIVPFGLQMWLEDFLGTRIQSWMIDEAEHFAKAHGEPFSREAWKKVINVHGGYLPLTIKAVPEGTPVASGNAIVTVECTDEDLFWLCSYIETALLRAIWYPTTIASLDYDTKQDIRNFYKISGADMSMVAFALHDFGGRGVTSAEQARIGGAAHLVNFMGSDTIEGVRAANYYYRTDMAAFSVPATEHSVQTSYAAIIDMRSTNARGSRESDELYFKSIFGALQTKGGIVSIVIDGYDTLRMVDIICEAKQMIIDSDCTLVLRPDSGDPLELIPQILRKLEAAFGSTINEQGYRKINNVKVLWGDGIDRMTIKTILGNLLGMNYRADNIVFGSGGALLQKVNRDTFKFAMKASAVRVNDKWIGISKDPVTDPGKRSKEGRLTLARTKEGKLVTVQLSDPRFNGRDLFPEMVTVYENGEFYNRTTLAEVRERVGF